jgi:hypothetical protein
MFYDTRDFNAVLVKSATLRGEELKLQSCIIRISCSNLSRKPNHSDTLLLFSSVNSTRRRYITRLAHKNFLPNPFPNSTFISRWRSLMSQNDSVVKQPKTRKPHFKTRMFMNPPPLRHRVLIFPAASFFPSRSTI